MTIDPPEIIEVEDTVVSCNGGGGALGHPRVFLNLESNGAIDCPYCDRPLRPEGRRGRHRRATRQSPPVRGGASPAPR